MKMILPQVAAHRPSPDRGFAGVRWLMSVWIAAAVGCGPPTKPATVKSARQQDPVAQMRAAMERGDWQVADRFSQQALIASPNDPELLTDAARIAAFCDRKRKAAQLLIDAATAASYQPPSRVEFAVQALIDVGELYEAIELLEKSLNSHPDNSKQRRILVGFLGEAQRTELISPHLQKLIVQRSFDIPLLVAVTENSAHRFASSTGSRLMTRNPDDHRVRLGEVRELLADVDTVAATRILNEIIDHHPDFAPAHAMLGQCLAEEGRWEEIPDWLENAPDESDSFADYWLTLGDWAAQHHQHDEAVRSYWEATKRDPNSSTAWARLSLAIRRARDANPESLPSVTPETLQDIDRRTATLLELRKRFYDFSGTKRTSQRDATRVAQSLLDLGRTWEAEAWSAVATTLKADPTDQLDPLRKEIGDRLREDPRWVSDHGHPALQVDLASLAMPRFIESSRPAWQSRSIPLIASSDHIRLSEESSDWGLRWVGGKSDPANSRLPSLVRTTGVGGGAIDYDLDGHPDLIVMGAGGTMLGSDSMPNELMRNLGEQFARVSGFAGVGDTGFGQGVAVGDFDEDGFPDLFFANLGSNRLLRNNGDGTFTDCSQHLQDGGAAEWTTSGAFVDITRDGICDLATTNYCATVKSLGDDCRDEKGTKIPCHPLKFPADGDRFFAGTSDGQMVDKTSQWIAEESPGRGLGIVAGMLDTQQLGVYVANDMSANSFYTRQQPEATSNMRLIETAAARGVAVNGRTQAQASMGIASSDFDGDGDLDFYVTGFGREHNVYYEQVAPGLWKDESGKLNLVQPTLPLVGFGTEAIDLDSDGVDEIVITNGHIGDFGETDVLSYEQPFQAFRRGPAGQFVLLEDDHWGPYFAQPHVGRALWTMDVNRDGRNDVLITHTYEPVRLLVNRSRENHHRIGFQLVGTSCSRDAIGATVRFNCNGRQRTLWCLAGHGYMCSNERTLRAGLGTADQVDRVTVTWQDGTVDRIGSLESNADYLIVQGEETAFDLTHF